MTLEADPISDFPNASGVLIVSGEDFVVADIRALIFQWIQEPGRLVLVVPPLQTGAEEIPLRWSVQYSDKAPEGGVGLASVLAGEVQYSLHGDFLTDHIRDMQFTRSMLAVGYYRPRVSTGIMAITVLPIWSLRVVDQPELLQGWIARLFELSGNPRETAGQTQQGPTLTPLHYSILLHLASRSYETMDAALDALENSQVLNIAKERGSRLCEDLEKLEYINGASLTDGGRKVLSKSPYAIYLNALKEGTP
jgi:hypothetical protein